MASALIGSTGFVGSNLLAQRSFDACYDSATVGEAAGRPFDLVVCAAPRAVKWWANLHPAEDREHVGRLVDALARVEAERFVLLSTVDVFPRPTEVDEGSSPEGENHPYGRHRLELEGAVRDRFGAGATVVRLPALFGPGLKKNVLYDLLHGHQVDRINPSSCFQWYDLGDLWADLEVVLASREPVAVFATEPIATGRIAESFFPGVTGLGTAAGPPVRYDVRTRLASLFGRPAPDPYMRPAPEMLQRLGRFVAREVAR